MSQDWNIKSRDRECHVCHTAFTDGQTYVTRLVYGQEGYARNDYCDTCWQQRPDPQAHFSVWKGLFRIPPPEPEKTVKKETAEALLRDLVEHQENQRTAAIYILAVMLERKRILVERDIVTDDNGVRRILYEHRKTGESFAVRDPQLKLEQLDEVQKEIMALLTGEPAPEDSPESQPQAEPGTPASPVTPDHV